jgi:hypothetical protein
VAVTVRKVWALWSKPPKSARQASSARSPACPERRVAEIVAERQRLREVLVEAERAGERAGDLGHFQRVGQPRAVMVALVEHEDLRLVLEAAERGRMDDPVGIAPERVAAGAFRLRMEPPAGPGKVLRIGRAARSHAKSRK